MVSGRGNRHPRALASLAALTALVASLLGAAPVAAVDPGDEVVNAVPITTFGVPQDYDTSSATSNDADPTSCESQTSESFDGPFTHSFWHTFTPSSSGELFVDVNSFPDDAPGFLAILFVFTDDGQGGLDLVACNAFPATVDITVEAGRTYYAMTANLPPTPEDPPEQAEGGPAQITVFQSFVSGVTVDAKAAIDTRTHLVTVSGTVDCSTPAEVFVDVSGEQRIGNKRVFGGGGADEVVECDGPSRWHVTIAGGTASFNPGLIDVVVNLESCANVCVFDQVEESVKAQPVSNKPGPPAPPPPPAPANDEQADAIPIVVDGPSVTGDTTGATVNADTDPQECPFADFPPSSHTVWYSVTAPADGWVEVNTADSDYDTTLYALDGGTVIACNDDTFGVQSRVRFPATAGTTYDVMVGSFADSPGGNLVIRALTTEPPPPPPGNDLRTGAVAIGLGETTEQDASGATPSQDDPRDCPDRFGVGPSPTVWYRFTAPDDGFVEVDASDSNYPTFVFVLDGDTIVACDEGRVAFATTDGTAYDIEIGSFLPIAVTLRLTVAATEEPPPPPAPIDLTLTVDATASLNPKTGEATITGTATCSRPADGGEILMDVFQEGGRFDGQAFADGPLSCGTEPTPWSLTVSSPTTKFLGGTAQVHAEAYVSTDDGADDFQLIDTDVRLRTAGSKH